jgi:hypothetical protein
MATGPVVPVSALMESLEHAGTGGPEEMRTVPAPALEQALARAVGAGSAISEAAVPEAVVRQLVAEAASGEPDGRPVVLASDVERVIAEAAPAQQFGGPVIPVDSISQVLAQATVERSGGSSSVPAVLLEQALSAALDSSDAHPATGGAVIPVAAVEQAMAQAVPASPPSAALLAAGHPWATAPFGSAVPLPALSTWEQRVDATVIQRAATGDVVDSGPVLSGGPVGAWPAMPTAAPAVPRPEYAAEPEQDLAPVVELVSEAIGAEPPRNWVDMEDTEHLDELTKKIYDRVHDRLRRDVLVQRERSGQLMDFW